MALSGENHQNDGSFEKRLKELDEMAVEIVNALAEKTVNGSAINVADIYFVLSKAQQHVSLLNLAEIEEFKKNDHSNRLAV